MRRWGVPVGCCRPAPWWAVYKRTERRRLEEGIQDARQLDSRVLQCLEFARGALCFRGAS
jgi:hypothetical protein